MRSDFSKNTGFKQFLIFFFFFDMWFPICFLKFYKIDEGGNIQGRVFTSGTNSFSYVTAETERGLRFS